MPVTKRTILDPSVHCRHPTGRPPREFLLRLPVVDGHPAQEIGPGGLRVHATDVVLLPLRPSVRPLVMPEVEVPPSVEVANTSAASDFHFIPLSRGMPRGTSPFPGEVCESVASVRRDPEVQILP